MPAQPRWRTQQDAAALRQLCLLRELTRGPRTSQRLRDRFPGFYANASGRTTYDRDIRELRSRGLIETGRGMDALVRRTRLRGKPDILHLTADEHRAVRAARDARTGAPASPVPFDEGLHGERLDLMLRLIRDLEESPAAVSLGELASRFLMPVDRMYHLIDVMYEDDEGTGVEGLSLRAPDGLPDEVLDDPPPDVLGSYTVHLAPADLRRHTSKFPTRGRGLDNYGGFAYSQAEIDERLELISWALEGAEIGAGEQRAMLERAAWKLRGWRRQLASMSDSVT